MSYSVGVKKSNNNLPDKENQLNQPLVQKQIQIDPKLIREVDNLEADIKERKLKIDQMHDIFQNLNDISKAFDQEAYVAP